MIGLNLYPNGGTLEEQLDSQNIKFDSSVVHQLEKRRLALIAETTQCNFDGLYEVAQRLAADVMEHIQWYAANVKPQETAEPSSKETLKEDVEVVIKKYTILDSGGDHEYDLIHEQGGLWDNRFKLCASNHVNWSNYIKGTVLLTMIDDGNGLRFEGDMEPDYATPLYLKVLLNFYFNVFDDYDNQHRVFEEPKYIIV